MWKPDRRQWLQAVAAGALGGMSFSRLAAAETDTKCTLSTGTYGMKGVPLEKAIETIADIGFDGLEISVMPGLDAEPARMSPARRQEVGKLIERRGLKLTALMENLPPVPDEKQHQVDLQRLRRVLELSRDFNPARPPLVQTVLGGGKWDERKHLFRDRLGDWLALARELQVTIAIKPHRGGAMSRPAEAIWLIQQLGNSPRLRMVYDYSHYAFRDMPLADTVREALPYTAHVAVKDAVQQDRKVVFVLPGESKAFDYPPLLRLFYEGGYRGDFCCEVSGMVSGKPGYDPIAAAKTCYANMAEAFQRAKIQRG